MRQPKAKQRDSALASLEKGQSPLALERLSRTGGSGSIVNAALVVSGVAVLVIGALSMESGGVFAPALVLVATVVAGLAYELYFNSSTSPNGG